MTRKLVVAAFAAAVLAGCASSGARLAEVPAPPVVTAPVANPVPEWVTTGSVLNDDGSAVIVEFADLAWPSDYAALKAAESDADATLCKLVAQDALGMRGGLSGIRSHPVLNGKESGSTGAVDPLSLEERFAGVGFENSFSCNPPPAYKSGFWKDAQGVANGLPGYYVRLVVPAARMIKFYQATAQSSEARKKMLKAQRALSEETEERILQMTQRIRARAKEWELGKGVKGE